MRFTFLFFPFGPLLLTFLNLPAPFKCFLFFAMAVTLRYFFLLKILK